MADTGSLLNLFSTQVIGWAIAARSKQDLAPGGAEHGNRLASATTGLHSPHGPWIPILSPFAIEVEPMAPSMAYFQKLRRNNGLKVSMSGKGNCYDNSAVESFFKSLTAELVWRRNWQTRREVEVALFTFHGLKTNYCRATEYINGFYNPRRRHSAIGWKSPMTFEQKDARHEHLTAMEPRLIQSAFRKSAGRACRSARR